MPGFWRPPIDNDKPKALPHWRAFGVDQMTTQLRFMELDEKNPSGVLTLTTRTYIAPPSLGWGWHATTTYQILPDGSAMSVFVSLENPIGAAPQYLPRMGFDLTLANTLSHVKWYGRGPGESYPDKKNSQRIGIWGVDDVSMLHTPYEVPQENGNHADTEWLELTSGEQGPAVKVSRVSSPFALGAVQDARNESTAHSQFNFTATKYSAETIENAAHPHDLVEEGSTFLLRLDITVSGVGTAAVGPGPREEHLVKPVATSFGFILSLV